MDALQRLILLASRLPLSLHLFLFLERAAVALPPLLCRPTFLLNHAASGPWGVRRTAMALRLSSPALDPRDCRRLILRGNSHHRKGWQYLEAASIFGQL